MSLCTVWVSVSQLFDFFRPHTNRSWKLQRKKWRENIYQGMSCGVCVWALISSISLKMIWNSVHGSPIWHFSLWIKRWRRKKIGRWSKMWFISLFTSALQIFRWQRQEHPSKRGQFVFFSSFGSRIKRLRPTMSDECVWITKRERETG